jgi:hypothetical protein
VLFRSIFERVRGARVVVRARPGERVEARATVVSNRGRVFASVRTAVADASGRATLLLPYAAPAAPGAAGLAGPWEVEGAGRRFELLPSDGDVVAGRGLEAPGI